MFIRFFVPTTVSEPASPPPKNLPVDLSYPNIVAEFKIWDWWNGKNISDFEISENYRGLGLSYQLLEYATKRCGAKNLAVNKSNTIAKYIYEKYGFQVTDEDDEYYYMSLSEGNDGCYEKAGGVA